MKIALVSDKEYPGGIYWWKCPGCRGSHFVPANGRPLPNGAKWTVSGSLDCPTVRPSVNVKGTDFVCHSVVAEGKIQYEADCTHAMAGLTVDMIDV